MKQIDQIDKLNEQTSLKWRISDDTGGLIANGEFFAHWLDEIMQFNKELPATFSYSWSDTFDITDYEHAVSLDDAIKLIKKIEQIEGLCLASNK